MTLQAWNWSTVFSKYIVNPARRIQRALVTRESGFKIRVLEMPVSGV